MSQFTCMFCHKKATLGYVKNYFPCETNLHEVIRHTLYHKYATSQNYYYTNEINEILSKVSSSRTILYHDYVCFDEEDEYLKRFYEMQEYCQKSQLLTEFYKFHKDLPRWVVKQQILKTLNYYYDKRRKIEFYKIQRQIEHENQMNPCDPPKGIIGEKPMQSDSTPQSESSEPASKVNVENILKDISFSNNKNHNSKDISRILLVPESPLDQKLNSQPNELQQMITLLSTRQQSPKQKIQQLWFQKKRNQGKKSLKLDELALSLSARTHQNPQEAKMPLSARYQPSYSNKLIDQIQAKLQNKHTQAISRDKISDLQASREQLLKLKLDIKNNKNSSPKRIDQGKINEEIKQLEIKIVNSLKELKNNKNGSAQIDQKTGNNQFVSIDQKALHNMLNIPEQDLKIQSSNGQNITENGNAALKISQAMLLKQTYSSFNTTIPYQKQHQILDLKKLMSHKREQAPKTERIKKTIPTLNLNMIGTINQSASATTRNNSFTPSLAYAQLLTPKPSSNSQWKSLHANNNNVPLREKNSQQ